MLTDRPANPFERVWYAALAIALLATPLSACGDRSAPVDRAAFVRTEIVQPRDGQASVTLTGEVQARLRADLSFRVSGRVIARLVDVGAHVNAGDVRSDRSGRAAGRSRCCDRGGGGGGVAIARGNGEV